MGFKRSQVQLLSPRPLWVFVTDLRTLFSIQIRYEHSYQKSRMPRYSGFLLFTSSLLTLHSSAHSGFSEVISNSEKWKSALQCFVLPFINNIVVSTLFICIYRIFLAHWFCDTITQNIPLYSNVLLCYNKIILLTAKKDFIET